VHVCGIACDEHATDSIVPSLPMLAEKPRTPARFAHAEVGARDPVEGRAHLGGGDRLVQRRLLTHPVPRDGPIPAVAEGDAEHHPLLAVAGEHGLVRRFRELNVGQQDVGWVVLADEVDADQFAYRTV